MSRLLYAVALVAASLPLGFAHADPYNTSAAGLTCGFTTTDEPTGTVANPGTQIGETNAGPVFASGRPAIDDTTTPPTIDLAPVTENNPAAAELICEIQIGGTGTFAEADASHVVTSRGTVVGYLPPTLISYQATASDAVWSCTTLRLFDVAGASVDLYADSTTHSFTTDATTAKCDLAIDQESPPQEVCDAAPPACDLPVARRRGGNGGNHKTSPQEPFFCLSTVGVTDPTRTCVYQ